jgi:hypothetical protein
MYSLKPNSALASIISKLKRGDLGSITDVTYLPEDYGGQAQIWVRWDAGSILALIDGQDEWEAVE